MKIQLLPEALHFTGTLKDLTLICVCVLELLSRIFTRNGPGYPDGPGDQGGPMALLALMTLVALVALVIHPKRRFSRLQNSADNLNFPQKDCLRTRKLSR